jgi:hypothetical protein
MSKLAKYPAVDGGELGVDDVYGRHSQEQVIKRPRGRSERNYIAKT